MDITIAARLYHEANQDYSQKPWQIIDQTERDAVVKHIEFMLMHPDVASSTHIVFASESI